MLKDTATHTNRPASCFIACCSPVLGSLASITSPLILPSSVVIPVAVTTPIPRPRVIVVPANTMLFLSARAVLGGRILSYLYTGVDSPVSADSLT